MKLELKNVLLLSLLTTLVALVVSFAVLPENSGYAGLFFIAISPLFFIIFIIWTLIIAPLTEKKIAFIKLLTIFLPTVILQYLTIIIVMAILSSDDRYYNFNTFFTDSVNLVSDTPILLFTLSVATVYTLLLSFTLNKKKNDAG